jgi:hypothetical protein
MIEQSTHHAGAGKDIPTQTDTIAILDLAPLLLYRFVVHDGSGGGQYAPARKYTIMLF